MKPSDIRFSQDSIAPNFSNGNSIHGVIDEILKGETSVCPFEPISIWKEGDLWYSENNRRLYMFRVLECKGNITDVDVRKRSVPNRRRMTSLNQGVRIKIRRRVRPYSHSIDDIRMAEKVRNNQSSSCETAPSTDEATSTAGATSAMESSNEENIQSDRSQDGEEDSESDDGLVILID
ncbi:uncharacterized protein LOC144422162 [Styela clava]